MRPRIGIEGGVVDERNQVEQDVTLVAHEGPPNCAGNTRRLRAYDRRATRGKSLLGIVRKTPRCGCSDGRTCGSASTAQRAAPECACVSWKRGSSDARAQCSY